MAQSPLAPESNPLETLGFVSQIEQQLGNNAAATKGMRERYLNKLSSDSDVFSLEALWNETQLLRKVVGVQAQQINTLSETFLQLHGLKMLNYGFLSR